MPPTGSPCKWKRITAAARIDKGLPITENLRCLEDAEGERRVREPDLVGDRRVARIVRRELDEEAPSRVPLVELARRVEEARSIAHGHGKAESLPQTQPEGLQRRAGFGAGAQVGLDRRIGARYGLLQKGAERRPRRTGRSRAIDRYARRRQGGGLRRELPGLPVRADHPARRRLGRLHVRLIEGVDREPPAGRRRGHLPEEALRTQIEEVRHPDLDDGMARLGDEPQFFFARPVLPDADSNEDAVVAVGRRRPEGLAHDRQDPLPLLPGALRDELLDPVAEGGDLRREKEGELVPPAHRQLPQKGAEKGPALLPDGIRGRELPFGRRRCPPQKALHIHPDQGRRDQAEEGEGRIAPADRRVVEETVAKAVRRGDLGQRASGIGDGDEMPPRLLGPEPPGGEVVEVLEEREGLHRPARFGGDDEERPFQVEALGAVEDRPGVGAVEDGEVEKAVRPPEDPSGTPPERGWSPPSPSGGRSRTRRPGRR